MGESAKVGYSLLRGVQGAGPEKIKRKYAGLEL